MIELVLFEDDKKILNNILSDGLYFETLVSARMQLPYVKDTICVWNVFDNNHIPCGAVQILNGEATVCLKKSGNIDYEEIAYFISRNMFRGDIFCDEQHGNKLIEHIEFLYSKTSKSVGNLMIYDKNHIQPKYSKYEIIENPIYEKVYILLCSIFPDFKQSIVFDEWYTVTSYKIRHNQGFMVVIAHNNKYIGVGGCYSIANNIAAISGVGVIEDYRQKGIAGIIVNKLTEKSIEYGLSPVLASENLVSDKLYLKSGYEYKRKWMRINVE